MTVWCEFEVWPSYDPLDDNSDVIVTLEDGSRWAALIWEKVRYLPAILQLSPSTAQASPQPAPHTAARRQSPR